MKHFTRSLLTATAAIAFSTSAFAANVNTLIVTPIIVTSPALLPAHLQTPARNTVIVRQTGTNGSVTGNLEGDGLTVQVAQLTGNGNIAHFETPTFADLAAGALRNDMLRNWHLYSTGNVLVKQSGNDNKFKLSSPITAELYTHSVNRDIPNAYMPLQNNIDSQVNGNGNEVEVTNGSRSTTNITGNNNKIRDIKVNTVTQLRVIGSGNEVTRKDAFNNGVSNTSLIQGNNNKVVQNSAAQLNLNGSNNDITQGYSLVTLTGSNNNVVANAAYDSGGIRLVASNVQNGKIDLQAWSRDSITSKINNAINSELTVNSTHSNVNTLQETVSRSKIVKNLLDWQTQLSRPFPDYVQRPNSGSALSGNESYTQNNTQDTAMNIYMNGGGGNSVDLKQIDTKFATATILADTSNARINTKQWGSDNSTIRVEAVGHSEMAIDLNQGFKTYFDRITGMTDYKVASGNNVINAKVYGKNTLGINQAGFGNSATTTMISDGENSQSIQQNGNYNTAKTYIEGTGHTVNIKQDNDGNDALVRIGSSATLTQLGGIQIVRVPNDPLPANFYTRPSNVSVNLLQNGGAKASIYVSGSNSNIDLIQDCSGCVANIGAHVDGGNLTAIQRTSDVWNVAASTNSSRGVRIIH